MPGKKLRKWEGSRADRAVDRASAKKAGVSMKQWEKSPADKREDAANQAKLNRKAKRK